MNVIDIVIGALLAYAAFKGFKNGLFVEFASVAALLLGIWSAVKFSGMVETFIVEKLEWDYEQLPLIAFVVTFIAVVIGIHLVARVVDKLFKAIALGIIVRITGAIFGIVKIGFILSVVLMIVMKAEMFTGSWIPEDMKETSLFYTPVQKFAPNILPFFKFDEAEQIINEMLEA